ncbi:MAG: sigma-70 family RNA polymerase sigma factor [Chloroflexi bacterium]|nr:sigma-70 family RNA polymerase sigma factor [Chloroflexota bacterium]
MGPVARRLLVADFMPNINEPRLLEGARRFDRHTLAEIHDLFYPEVYRYAAYRLNDAPLAEDIAGEVFLRLLTALKQGKGPRKTLRGWLMGAASNIINDHYRHSYANPQSELDEGHAASNPGPADMVELGLRREALRAALRRLTAEQQHVLALRFGGEYSLEETAQAIGKSVNAVKSLQLRALNSLRRYLTEAGHE